MKKIICLITCIMLCIISICLLSSIHAHDVASYEGYSLKETSKSTKLYLREKGKESSAFLVYCFTQTKMSPPYLHENVVLPVYSEKALNDDKGYLALLYAGYPMNQTNLMQKYGIDEDYAYENTQRALWALQNVDTSIYLSYKEPFPSYYVELLNYVVNHRDAKFDGYQLAYYQSEDSLVNYQDMLTVKKTVENDKNNSHVDDNASNVENDCGCTTPASKTLHVNEMHYYFFISAAILLVVVVIIYFVIRSKKCEK